MIKKKFFTKDLLFYVVMLAIPVLQFCIFYIGVNGRSLLYAFQEIDIYGNATFSFKPMMSAFETLFTPTMARRFFISIISFVLTYGIGTILALFFSYFIYKKIRFSSFFKVFLFLPSIISSIILATLFKYFAEEAVPAYANDIFHQHISGLLSTNPDLTFIVIIFYHILVSFGTSVLMYSNAMSGISDEVVEAAKIDGCNQFKEFFHIILPGIFPTITTFAITSVAAIFVNQISLFSFFSNGAITEIQTVGYYLYVETLTQTSANQVSGYPLLCAIGLLLSLVAIPVTILTKYLLEKYGPSEK